MTTAVQEPNICVLKVCNSVLSGVCAFSVLMMGNQVYTLDCNNHTEQQIVRAESSTNIYKSFTDNYCINIDYPDYIISNNVETGKNMSLLIDEEKVYNLRKIEDIASLQDNWNGNGAKTFSDVLIQKVKNLLIMLQIQPEVFPTACDSLQFEYDTIEGAHLEIEITEHDEAEVFWVDKDGSEQYLNIETSVAEINRVVELFYG